MEKIEKIVREMTLEEKISFCTGADFWHTKPLPAHGVPGVMMSDGPNGLRCQRGEADMIGVNKSLPATCFPPAGTAGAGWDPDLYAAEGEAIGREGLAAGVPLILGPGCNIKRDPLGGRNFEYLSEDPYFAGKMAAAFIQGLQSTGAAASLKHFAANNQEYKRQNGDSQVDERALREIYLAPFETAVREGKPDTVMCAYNKINGVHCSDSKVLLTDTLRGEWGFDGMVVTDWGALNDRIKGFHAGCDLNMPGGARFMEKAALAAVREERLKAAEIDASVTRILRFVEKARKALARNTAPVDWDAHHALAQKIAEQGAVLLKNDGGVLPLVSPDAALIGYMAKEPRYQGSGSSHINPTRLVSLTDAFPDMPFFACCDVKGNVTEDALRRAVELAQKHDTVIVAAGLPEIYESEAFDREHMRLPDGHNRMVEAVAAANPNTVVVLMGGGAMELPWADKVRAILYMGLPGQAGGTAAANLLTGAANPSGKLTETWPLTYQDTVSRGTFGQRNVEYRESVYVGYRYYDAAQKRVRYPFGHGLSYTAFAYSDLIAARDSVTVSVMNTGARAGAEVVQLYIAPPQSGLFRPRQELKGFARVELAPGETKRVRFALDDRSFALWSDRWKVPGGTYTVRVGASSRDIRLEGTVEVTGENIPVPLWQKGSWYETLSGLPPRAEWEKLMGCPVPQEPEPKKGRFTLDNTCLEMKDFSLIQKIQYKVTEHIIAKGFGGKKDLSDPAYRMTLICAVDCPMRAVVINSGGAMSDAVAQGMVEMANGHWLKGLSAMMKQ